VEGDYAQEILEHLGVWPQTPPHRLATLGRQKMEVLTSLAEVTQWLSRTPEARIVGIVGPPGSGKSTLASELSHCIAAQHSVVPMDGFHYPQDTLRAMNRRDRMGAPDTFDAQALAELLELVKDRNGPVAFPEFDRTIEEPKPNSITVIPDDELVIVEGNYLLLDDPHWAPVGKLLDLSIYVDIPDALRHQRLIKRHVDYGKSAEDAAEWVNRVDAPNARFVEAARSRATAFYQAEG
jgi:pantothenate kinase